jgi:F-type H+-transporting ATPase subunit b
MRVCALIFALAVFVAVFAGMCGICAAEGGASAPEKVFVCEKCSKFATAEGKCPVCATGLKPVGQFEQPKKPVGIIEMLGIDWRILIIQIGGFILLFVFLKLVLFKPVSAHLKKRKDDIKASFDKIAAETADVQKKQKDYEERLANIEREAERIKHDLVKEGTTMKTDIIGEAYTMAEQIKTKAEADALMEKEKAMHTVHQEVVSLALAAAEKLVQKKMDEPSHRALVESFLNDLGSQEVTGKWRPK